MIPVIRKALIWFLIVSTLVGCSRPPTQSPTVSLTSSPNPLTGTYWNLILLKGQPLISGTRILLHFTDQEFNGNAGCNDYHGPYDITGQQVIFEITVMLCRHPDLMDQEKAYVDTLGKFLPFQPAKYRLTHAGNRTQLEFLGTNSQGALVYEEITAENYQLLSATTYQPTPTPGLSTNEPSATPTPTPSSSPTMDPIELYIPLTTPVSMDGYTLLAQRGGAPAMFGSSVALQGQTAYVGFGPRLAAIDVRQPSEPHLLAQSPVLPGNVTGVIVLSTGPTPELIASVGQYLFILDQPEPGEIKPVGQVTLPGKIEALILDPTSQTLYVGGEIVQLNDVSNGVTSSGFITTIDVSDPANPRGVDQVDLADRVVGMALAQKTMLYAGTLGGQSPSGIQGINLDAGAPAKLSSPTQVISGDAGQPYAMQVLGDRLYISWNTSISAYDISDAFAPQELWKATQAVFGSSYMFSAFGFVLHTDRIDIVGYNSEGGFVAPPASFKPPQPVTGTSGAVAASMMASAGHMLYVARDGLEIYDILDPMAIKTQGGYHPSLLYVAGQVTQGDYIYSVDEVSLNQAAPFLHVLQTSDLEMVGEYPIILPDGFPLMHWYWGMVLDGDRLYVYGYTGVYIFDITDPTQPAFLGHPNGLGEGFYRMAATTMNSRRLLFICASSSDGGTALRAYDTTDVSAVTELVPSIEFSGESGNSLKWSGSSLYLLTEDGQGTGWFYTVTLDKAGFTIKSRMALPGGASTMAVQGNRMALFAASKLMILSIANPSQPQVISQTSLAGSLVLRQLSFQGNQLLAIGNEGTFQLITYDLSNPTHPVAVKAVAIPTADGFDTLSVSGERVVVSGQFSGIEVWK